MADTTTTNLIAVNGVDRCDCGCKYWEGNRCVDCGDRAQGASPVHGDRRLDRTTFSDGSHVDSFVYWSADLTKWVSGTTFDLLAEDGE